MAGESSGVPENVDEQKYPVKTKKGLNKVFALLKRPWTISFNTGGTNEFKFSEQNVILDLNTIKITMCLNGKPTVYRIIGSIDNTQNLP